MITPTSSGGSSRIIMEEAFQMSNLRTLPCDGHEARARVIDRMEEVGHGVQR